jgi:hypothetical protein
VKVQAHSFTCIHTDTDSLLVTKSLTCKRISIAGLLLLLCGQDSSVGIATRYGLKGPGIESRGRGKRISVPVQTGPGAHPASYTMGIRSFSGVKRPGGGADHPPPAEFEGRVELYICSLLGLLGLF